MRRRFFWAIFGVAAAVVLVFGLGMALVQRRLAVDATFAEMGRAAEETGALIAQQVAGAGIENVRQLLREPEVRQNLVRLQRAAGGADLAVALVTPDGRVEALSSAVRSKDLDPQALLAGDQIRRAVRIGRVTTLLVAQPAVRLGDDGPLLAVVLTRTGVVIDYRSQVRIVIVLLAGAAMLAAVAARLLARGMARRLEVVAHAAEAFSDGRLDTRVPPSGNDEVTRVGEAFNSMADQLSTAARREREFLLAVGHDLRTPLTTLAGYAEALEEDPPPAEIRRIAGVVSVETGRLRRLIEDLMLAARLGTNEFTLRPETVDVAAHLRELAAGFASRAAALNLRITARVEPTGLRVVDPDRLTQVVANLVENALRYTPEAGEVDLTVGTVGNVVHVVVRDNGPGIDPDDLPRIFEKFFVAQKYRRVRPEGSGLGLSIVAQLVEKMGGTVNADSRPGAGTTISVALPAPVA